MSFKCINPGYGYLVDPAFETIWSTRLSPRLGVSFYLKNHSDGYKGYTIPAIGYGGTLYFKFDVFIPKEKFSLLTGLGNDDYKHAWIDIWSDGENFSLSLIDMYGDTPIWVDNEFGDFFNFDTVNTIWVQIRLEDEFDEDGGATVKVNGKTIGECKDLQTWAQAQTMFVINGKEKTPVSNLIISDEYIDPDENIFRVSSRGMNGAYVTKDRNFYRRTFEVSDWDWFKHMSHGEVELTAVTPRNLYSATGASEQILTMVSILAPAFYTGSDVAAQYFSNTENSKAQCYVVTGSGSEEYHRTSYPWQNLSSDTSAVLIQYLPVTSDTTFASINGIYVGWRADLGSA